MSTSTKIPNRTRQPDSYDYILIDKKDFRSFTKAVIKVIDKQMRYAHEPSIRVDGFDDYFETINDFLNTLGSKEWQKLTSISVYFYPVDRGKHGYANTVYMRFGGYSSNGPGLRVEYEKSVSDAQRYAIKTNFESIAQDYIKQPLVNDTVFSVIVTFLVATGLIYFYISSVIPSLSKVSGGNFAILTGGLLYIPFIFYILSGWLHRKISPHFQPVINKSDTRIKRVVKIIVAIGGVVGFVGTIIAVIQFFTHK